MGIVIRSWSETQIEFEFGSSYNPITTPQWTLNPGDSYTLTLGEVKFSGSVSYT